MLFINTRPSDRAVALSTALSKQQVNVFELPLLELQALEYNSDLYFLYQQLAKSHVIVVVSPTAVEIGMQYLMQSGIAITDLCHVQWIAVGLKTAQALAGYGIQASIPEVETSEGMLQLPNLQNLAVGSCIAFWRGEGGRQFMMQQLHAAGMQILNFVLYQRRCPVSASTSLDSLVTQIQQHKNYTVLISSEASWCNWLELLQQYPKIVNQARYMVLGSRLTQLLTQYQHQQQAYFQIIEVFELTPNTIMAHLNRDEGKA
jgi:uroporphyrinogen-III synthase